MTEAEGIALVQQVFPDLEVGPAGYVLWNETGYPSFWNIPEDGQTPEECCLAQLRRYKDRVEVRMPDRDEVERAFKESRRNADGF